MRWHNRISGAEGDTDLFHRILNSFMFLGIIISLISTMMGLIFNQRPVVTAVTGGLTAIFTLLFYLSRCKKIYRPVAITAVTILLGISPVIWIYNGGTGGGFQYFFIFIGVVIVTLLRRWVKYCYLMIYLLLTAGMIYYELIAPGGITGYPDLLSKFLDQSISFFIATTATWLLFIIISNNHDQEHRKMMNRNDLMRSIIVEDRETALLNHQYIMERLKFEILRGKRYKRPFTIVIVDIDRSKQLADRFGIDFKNQIIRDVAGVIFNRISDEGLSSRYHNDQFLIVLPGQNLDQGYLIGEEIRSGVDQLTPLPGVNISVSCSVVQWGGAGCDPLLEQGFFRLYLAKERGGNLTICDNYGVY